MTAARDKLRDGAPGSRVDRAAAAVRWWELEAAMLRDWHLTLPPETEPLDESRRKAPVRRLSINSVAGSAPVTSRRARAQAKERQIPFRVLDLFRVSIIWCRLAKESVPAWLYG